MSLPLVKQKSQANNILANTDPRKIYDRLRQECQRSGLMAEDSVQPSTSGLQLDSATDEQNAPCIVVDRENMRAGVEGSDDDADVVDPSVKSSKSLFSNAAVDVIRERCGDIIKSGPISQRRISEA